MRHVDDAHDAKGDRQPGGREEQDGAKRNSVINALDRAPELQLAINRTDGGDRGSAERRRFLLQRIEDHAAFHAAVRRNRGDGCELVLCGCLGGGQQRCRAGLGHSAANLGIFFGGNGAIERRDGEPVVRVEHRLGGGAPLGRVGSEQAQGAESFVDRLTHSVVDPDLFERTGGCVGDGLAGSCIDEARRGSDQERAIGTLVQLAVMERRDDGQRARIARATEFLDALPDLVEAGRGEKRIPILRRRPRDVA